MIPIEHNSTVGNNIDMLIVDLLPITPIKYGTDILPTLPNPSNIANDVPDDVFEWLFPYETISGNWLEYVSPIQAIITQMAN